MKISLNLSAGLMLALLAGYPQAVFAQQMPTGAPLRPPSGMDFNKSSSIPEPSQIPPPLPEAPPPAEPPKQVFKSMIPPLPVSVPCTAKEVVGLWKLQRLYEEPAGNEIYAFEVSPVQYVSYEPNGLYGRYNGSIVMPPKLVINEIKKHSTGLQQYLVQDSGVMYYYQDKVANDEQSCFIVAKDSAPFFKGNMLQMPPKGKITGRLIRHYVRIGANPTAPAGQPGPQNRPQMPDPNKRPQPQNSGQVNPRPVVIPRSALEERSGELYRPPDPNKPAPQTPATLDDIH